MFIVLELEKGQSQHNVLAFYQQSPVCEISFFCQGG